MKSDYNKIDVLTLSVGLGLAGIFTLWFCTHLERIEPTESIPIQRNPDPNYGGSAKVLRTKTEAWITNVSRGVIPNNLDYEQACEFEQEHIDLFQIPEPTNSQVPYTLSGGRDSTFIPGPPESNVEYWNAIHVTVGGKRYESDPYSGQVFVMYRNGGAKFIPQSESRWVLEPDGKGWTVSFKGDKAYTQSRDSLPFNDPTMERRIVETMTEKRR